MGYFSRYQQGPYAVDGIDPRTGQPIMPMRRPPMATPAPGTMPWDVAPGGGQGFADMYAPQPQQPKPQAPRQTVPQTPQQNAAQPPMFGNLLTLPLLPGSATQADPSLVAYGPGQDGGQMRGNMADPGMDPALAAYDPAAMAYMQKDIQPQAGDQALASKENENDWLNGQPFGGVFGEVTGDLNGMDMLSLGLSLLGNSQNGGNWAQVGQDLMGINQGATQRKDRALSLEDREREIKRQEEADKRTAELFGYQVDELKAGQEERAYAKANRDRLAVVQKTMVESTTDPAFRAVIESMAPEQFGEFMGNRLLRQEDRLAEDERIKNQQEFQARENALDRDFQARMEAIKKKDPMQTVEGKASIAAIEPYVAAAGNAGAALNRVGRMKEIITTLHGMGGTNQPINADTRIYLSRLTGNSREAQALMEEYNNLALAFTLEEVQKLKPASNLDFKTISESLPNVDNNPLAAMNMLNRMERDLNNAVQGANDRISWVEQGNSIYGKNAEGKTFFEAHPNASSATTPATSGPQEQWQDLPPVANFKEGEVIVSDTGQRMKRQGNQWVPVGKAAPMSGALKPLPKTSFQWGVPSAGRD